MAHPNIVMILLDDLGWMDLSCQGSKFYETPNIDRLFQRGMSFDNAYAACPVCSPSRASILSGKYPARLHLTDWIDHGNYHPCKGKLIDAPYIKGLPLTEHSLAASLKDAGYQTWHLGKWHLGKNETYPEKHGFDVNIGGCFWGHPAHGYFSPYQMETLTDGPEGEYLTQRLGNEAVRLIRERDKTKPFFLNFWHYAVHAPMQAPADLVAYFEEKSRKMGLDKLDPFEVGEHFPIEAKKDQRVVRRTIQSDPVYAAMIYSMDQTVGQLVETLRQEGLEEDTIVIFTSDNGGLATAEGSPTCNYPLSEGKGWMYEGAVREPLAVVWPGHIPAGAVSHEITTSPDFYPTLLELAGLPLQPQQHVDGVSLAGLLLGKEDSLDREAVYWHYPHYGNQGGTPGSSLRSGRWKYIEFYEDNSRHLFDLETDVAEKKDVAALHPDLVERFHGMLAGWLRDCDAAFPTPNPDFK